MRPLSASGLSRLAPLALVAGLAGPGVLAAGLAPAHAASSSAAEKVECSTGVPGDDTPSTDVSKADDESNPTLQALRLDDVHEIATGKGIGVAVIDSGVQASPHLTPRAGMSFVGGGEFKDGHGTIVAGLIAGQDDVTSIAPGAHVISLRVSAAEPDDQDGPQPSRVDPVAVAEAINWAVDHRKDNNIRVINLSLGFSENDIPDITKAIAKAEDAGIVVVAAAGNRPAETTEDPDEAESSEGADKPEQTPDEVLFPATLDNVLAVTARDENLAMTTTAVYAGPEIDVSAPVVGLRSVMLGGLLCDIPVTASSWAAAEVSGLAALLLQQDPDLAPAQVRTRIEVTAQGGFQDSATDGHGMIQPYEALTAVLDIAKDGSLREGGGSRREQYVADKPEVRGDEYAASREHLVWWGVGAGGAVLLVLILRPLTARRRH